MGAGLQSIRAKAVYREKEVVDHHPRLLKNTELPAEGNGIVNKTANHKLELD